MVGATTSGEKESVRSGYGISLFLVLRFETSSLRLHGGGRIDPSMPGI